MASNLIHPSERIYVKVVSEFDETGYMIPKTIVWHDGRTFPVIQILDFRPAVPSATSTQWDCYTVDLGGQKRKLFFEREDLIFLSRIGRWFVERQQA